MSLSVLLLLNKPHTQESTVLLLRRACTTEDHIGLFSTKAFLSQSQTLLNTSFPCTLNAVSPRPLSLYVSFMSSYFYPVPSIRTYLSLFFFLSKSQALLPIYWEVKCLSAEILNPYWLYAYLCSGVVLEICLLKMYPQCWKDLWVGFPSTFLLYWGCSPSTKDGQRRRCPEFWPQTFVPDLILQVTVVDDNPLPGLPATRA